ncbi:hypothetical protein ACOYR1_01395 [Thalassotalea piscium]
MYINILLLILTMMFSSVALATSPSQQFFQNLKAYCGQTMVGKSVFPVSKEDAFYGKTLVMKVASCTETEMRIPFSVGEDHSRTWILTLTEKGLLFKHDHRLEDGSPDKLTMYGGYSDGSGSAFEQHFPADAETKQLVPKGKTNVWSLTLDKKNAQFIYYLSRHNEPRFKAVFDLK